MAKPESGEPELQCPEPLTYLWLWFWEILSGCSANGFTPKAIGWSDLSDWCALTGNALERWEVQALIALAAQRAEILSEQKKSKAGK